MYNQLITAREANKFLIDQEKLAGIKKSNRTIRKENQCFQNTPIAVKNHLQKQFAQVVASEVESRTLSSICGTRTKQQSKVAKEILKILTQITGEKCTIQNPNNVIQCIHVYIADQVAVWLTDVVDDADSNTADRKERELNGEDIGGKGDGIKESDDEEDNDVEFVNKRKKPSKRQLNQQTEGGGDGSSSKQSLQKSVKPSQPAKTKDRTSDKVSTTPGTPSSRQIPQKSSSRPGNEKTPENNSGSASVKKYGSSRNSVQPKPKTSNSTSKIEASKSTRETRISKSFERPVTKPQPLKQEQSNVPSNINQQSTTENKAQAGQTKQPRASISNRSVTAKAQPDSTATSRSMAVNKQPGTSTSDGAVAGKKQLHTSASNRSVTGTTLSSKSEKVATSTTPNKTDSEQLRNKLAEIVSAQVSRIITEDGKTIPSARQEALQDILGKQLEERLGGHDSVTLNAIGQASALISTFIDQTTRKAELEYGDRIPLRHPVSQKGKGPVFSVKKLRSDYEIKPLSNSEAQMKVYKARGLTPPGTITLSKGPFKLSETQDWVKYTNEVTSMADRWSKWIDATVKDAVKTAEIANRASTDNPTWKNWRDTRQSEALEWRRNKKLLDTQVELFRNKANLSMAVNPTHNKPAASKNSS